MKYFSPYFHVPLNQPGVNQRVGPGRQAQQQRRGRRRRHRRPGRRVRPALLHPPPVEGIGRPQPDLGVLHADSRGGQEGKDGLAEVEDEPEGEGGSVRESHGEQDQHVDARRGHHVQAVHDDLQIHTIVAPVAQGRAYKFNFLPDLQ